MITSISKLDIKIEPEKLFYFHGNSNYLCFLDSSLYANKFSKFSYIGFNPKFVLKSFGYNNYLLDLIKGKTSLIDIHPLEFLNMNLKKFINFNSKNTGQFENIFYIDENNRHISKNILNDKKYIIPDFTGGFIGYFSYDLKNFIEVLPQNAVTDLPLPLIYLIYFDEILAYSHLDGCWYLIKILDDDNALLKNNFTQLKKLVINNKNNFNYFLKKTNDENCNIKKMTSNFKNQPTILNDGNFIAEIKKKYLNKNIKDINLKSNFTKHDYLEAIKKAKKYIHEGEVYQINMTQRFHCDLPVEARDLYYILRHKNPAPFSAYINLPEVQIGCSSPERFLYIDKDYVETRPIKGTRPRGKNEIEDKYFINELANSLKDHAELNMIVDLERNDLGKFCDYGTVKVKAHAEIEKYAKVFHLVSTVTGKIKKNIGFAEVLKAVFPGGSITGAPKIRAMQIIDELEPVARNIYTGCLGYIAVNGKVDLNIVIRSFIISGSKFYYNAGGGIVEDSNPENEYYETLDKGKALEESLNFFKIF